MARMLCVLLLTCLCSLASAAGHAYDTRFSVLCSGTEQEAQQILDWANDYLVELSRNWVGRRYKHTRTTINVVYTNENKALTWGRTGLRTQHIIYLSCPRQIVPYLLKHEMAHVVLFSNYKNLPAWVHEGIATRYDDPARRRSVDRAASQRLDFDHVQNLEAFQGAKHEHYAAAEIMVNTLLQKGGIDRFRQFLRQPRLKSLYGAERLASLIH